jgi:endonuclease/exonuclease/phosphatase family metal-dependent hydrolase
MIGIAVVLVMLLLLLAAWVWAAGGQTVRQTQGSGIIESIPDAIEQHPLPSHTLTVMSFNLAYGLGHQQGAGQPLAVSAIYDRLDHIVETIAASEADVVLLQAVDFSSRRTHDIDQLYHIAAALGWGFAARAQTWACRYLPYPVWPLGCPSGRLRAGMGVISRFPLVQNLRYQLPQPGRPARLVSGFQPLHTVQMVDVQCGVQAVRLFNVHLHSGAAAGRLPQAQSLMVFVQQMATPNSIVMGSFNAAIQSSDATMNLMLDGLRDHWQIADDAGLTYPAMAPHSRLDHAFIASGLQLLDTQVVMPEQPVTDHLPLMIRLRWQLPLLMQDGRSTHERL